MYMKEVVLGAFSAVFIALLAVYSAPIIFDVFKIPTDWVLQRGFNGEWASNLVLAFIIAIDLARLLALIVVSSMPVAFLLSLSKYPRKSRIAICLGSGVILASIVHVADIWAFYSPPRFSEWSVLFLICLFNTGAIFYGAKLLGLFPST